eukprot:gene17746-biopygen3884
MVGRVWSNTFSERSDSDLSKVVLDFTQPAVCTDRPPAEPRSRVRGFSTPGGPAPGSLAHDRPDQLFFANAPRQGRSVGDAQCPPGRAPCLPLQPPPPAARY